jgi:(p)ppGpp synthase/HD superfamily hydrolase
MVTLHADPPPLSERFLAAVALATELQGRDRRAGTQIPYLAHLLVVTGLVLEDGGDEDQAIAAMLHDAVEDGGGSRLLKRIERSFGPKVAGIVERLSDRIDEEDDESWVQRKQRYLAHLEDCEDDATLRVALADKVHNARSIVRGYREEGHQLWERFTQKTAQEQVWYYGRLVDLFTSKRPGPLTTDLRMTLAELSQLISSDPLDSGAPYRPDA